MRTERLSKTHYSAALYMRLSRDDEGVTESSSITTQRNMLRAYANENHFTVFDEYVDDGVSGTTFDRPDFKRMISDIENKKVNMVITKDLSRLGRDYILAGQYTEIYFPSKKVRYIAINDGYDSDSPYTDIAPFKNVINEMYARDTSKKIRSAFVTRMHEGAFVGAFAPYGYKRDPLDKHHLIIDDTSAQIVKVIFEKASQGILPIQIARELNDRNIPTPIEYRCMLNPNINVDDFSKRKEWTSSTITKLLRNIVYLGHMAQGKTTKVSFKSNVTVANPKEDWIVVENTHEPLVSREIFDLAARRSKQRTCFKKGSFNNIFSGIAKCADCGRNMSTVGSKKKGAKANLACGGYKLYGNSECSNHFIDYDVLYDIVLSSIKELVSLSEKDESEILKKAQAKIQNQSMQMNQRKEIRLLEKRSRELDQLIEKMYEDHVEGYLSADQMKKLLIKYQGESENVQEQLKILKEAKDTVHTENTSDKLKKILRDFTNPTELSPEMLYRLIDHIEIGQGCYQKTEYGKVKNQTVKIYFRFVGTPVIKTYKA